MYGSQTPMYGSQTPGSRTPMYGSQTPTHDGKCVILSTISAANVKPKNGAQTLFEQLVASLLISSFIKSDFQQTRIKLFNPPLATIDNQGMD